MSATANDDFLDPTNSSGFSGSASSRYSDRLADKISLLAGQINAANYRFLKLVAEFDALEAWAGYGFRSCASCTRDGRFGGYKCGV